MIASPLPAPALPVRPPRIRLPWLTISAHTVWTRPVSCAVYRDRDDDHRYVIIQPRDTGHELIHFVHCGDWPGISEPSEIYFMCSGKWIEAKPARHD